MLTSISMEGIRVISGIRSDGFNNLGGYNKSHCRSIADGYIMLREIDKELTINLNNGPSQ